MNAKLHPEHKEESTKLITTLSYIQSELTRYADPLLAYGADNKAASLLWEEKVHRKERLKEIQTSPYFGRVDWIQKGQEVPETFYVGKFELSDQNIFSWQNTLPGELYYVKKTSRESGKLLLTRTFMIQSQHLTEISDDHVDPERRKFFAAVVVSQSGDNYLIELLEKVRDGHLHDIVATIQSHQYQLITQNEDGVLVIQGSPGSGKTQIALHRISYLLYKHQETKRSYKNRLLFLGPNPIFLRYIQNVLPELGDRQIPQLVFDELARQQLKESLNYQSQEETLDQLLSAATPDSVKTMLYRNAYNKASLSMATLIENYVEYLWQAILQERETVVVRIDATSLEGKRISEDLQISVEKIREVALRLNNVALNQRKDELIEKIAQDTTYTFRTAHDVPPEQRSNIEKLIQDKLRLYFSDWAAQNTLVAYRRLFRTSELLHQLGQDIFSEWDLELMHLDAPKQTTPFRFSDLGGLLYLQLLLDGRGERQYDHIVVDEAQDLTPLYFKVLSYYCPSHSFTITGDLSQGIYPYHNLVEWEALQGVFGSNKVSTKVIRQSYRSTRQIMDYANDLLRRIGEPKERLAEPINRDGMRIDDWGAKSSSERAKLIKQLVNECLDRKHKSIAVIGKTVESCRVLATELSEVAMADMSIIQSRTDEYNGGIALIPSYLAKGIEFDVVIVADADEVTYAPTVMDARLLYVVLTRASHELHVCWVGNRTGLLRNDTHLLSLQDHFQEQLSPQLMTVEEYALLRMLSPDWCIARLAALGKLNLLQNGKIDAICADMYLTPWEHKKDNEADADTEDEIEALEPMVFEGIRARVAEIVEMKSASSERTLAGLQLIYALLRNILGNAGILEMKSEEAIADQATALATLGQAMQRLGYMPSPGSWTSKKQALDRVAKKERALAGELFELLMNYGLIEQNQRGFVRVVGEWIPDLLRLAMGSISARFDAELIEALGTDFMPIHSAVPVEGEVQYVV